MLIPSWNVVEQFEQRMAEYCGAPYAVAVDTCTAAIFLCLKRLDSRWISIPQNTYLGVACAVLHSGAKLNICKSDWWGAYYLEDRDRSPIVDSACRLMRDMYNRGTLTCLSFQVRKHLKIGRGGMILTDDVEHAAWFRKARFLGRAEHNGVPEFVGYHAFMEPERAARGLQLMDSLPDNNPDLVFQYEDLRTYEVLKNHCQGITR